MIERGGGWIVNVSSLAALTGGDVGASASAAAKGGLSTLTKALTREFVPRGAGVKEALESVARTTPFRRLGTTRETAAVILFFCSQEARFIHGQVVEVNGGFFMA